mmetsp:Transcript_17745/g.33683  ORF Transcript_17745/g.33683 Transcript_17745/m.33683 type:complete len:282 (-) Transcript_17745:148-993(-)
MNRNISNSAPTLSYSVVPTEEFCTNHGNFRMGDAKLPEQDDDRSALSDLLQKLKLGKLKRMEAIQKQKRVAPVKERGESQQEKVAVIEEKEDDKPHDKTPRCTPRPSRTRRGGTRYPSSDRIYENTNQVQIGTTQTTWRRGSLSSFCDSSVSSVDTELTPKKKRIDLRPHRSSDLYEAQRNDEELRDLLRSKTTNVDFVVAKVHGKNLVFFGHDRRVYIPANLRAKTMKYYRKNFKYSSKQRLAESCYWPNMERDQRRAKQWKVMITEPGKDPKFIYDSDE